MKHINIFTLVLLMSMASTKVFAYDIAVANADGKTIYYNYINNGTELEVTNDGSSFTEYSGNIVIPETVNIMNHSRKVTSIGSAAFSGHGSSNLTSVTIPNSVTSIGNYAFYNCGLKSVTIPNSVTSIGSYAFEGCSGLTSMTIGNGVTSIGFEAFARCSGLEKVIIKDIAAWCRIKFSDYDSNPLYYAHHLYSDENTEITNLVIPNSVTSIGDYAFSRCSGLTSVTIPNSVTSIGGAAFARCDGLTSVTIPNSVTYIGTNAFARCSGLTSVTIPNSVTSIGSYTFEGCSGLTSVTIPNSVTSIDRYAFEGCSGLTSVTIGNGVTSIYYAAFKSCVGLKKVIIKDIAAWCRIKFSNYDYSSDYSSNPLYYAHHLYSDENTEITNLVIPNSVTSIGSLAFYGCSGLTSVTIGSGVKSIGSGALNCDNLATVISKIETPFAIIGKSSTGQVFSNNTFMNADLFVPVGTIDKYKSTEGWKDFIWITEGIPSGIEGVKTEDDKTEVSRYTLDGKKLSEPQKGINIIKMSDGTTKKELVR